MVAGKKVVAEDMRKSESLAELRFGKVRSTLEALVGVFLKDGCVVTLGLGAALENEIHDRIELSVGVVGIVDMLSSLYLLAGEVAAINRINIPRYPSSASDARCSERQQQGS